LTSVITGLIGGLIAVVLTAVIAKRVGKAKVPGQLKFGAFMWILALCCLAFAFLPIASTVIGHDKDFWYKVALVVGFGAGAVYCFGEAAFVHGTFDEEGIAFSTPWTGAKQERWVDLESVKFNDWCSWYTLRFKSGKTIRLSSYLSGHLSALERARERLTIQENGND
jgi:hypothetical protein